MLENLTLTGPWSLEGDSDEYPVPSGRNAQLEGIETSGFRPNNLAEHFRHSGWQRQREKVRAAFQGLDNLERRIEAFENCGTTCYVLRSRTNPTEHKIAASCCHDRFCLPCANTRARTICANVSAYLSGARCRFLTFTLKHNDQTLAHEIDRLYAAFKKLRGTKLWKTTQTGGVAFLEIKRSHDRKSWHPHLHVLSQGKFISGPKLCTQWKTITGDSFIVDIRLVENNKHVVWYITKYASKPFDQTLFEDRRTLMEAIAALIGRRMAATFGKWKGLQMTEKPCEDAWEFLDTLEGIVRKAATGDSGALAILKAVAGDRSTELLRIESRRTVPRMNPIRPPTPIPELYLIAPGPHSRCTYP